MVMDMLKEDGSEAKDLQICRLTLVSCDIAIASTILMLINLQKYFTSFLAPFHGGLDTIEKFYSL
jgi:hypothetical protein